MDINEYFGKQLKKARKNAHMTQAELGQRLGYTCKSVSKWELGQGFPNINAIAEISSLLKVSVDSLIVEPRQVRYFLGIYGASNKTIFMLVDSDRNVIKEVEKEPCNPSNIGIKRSLEILQNGIEDVCGNVDMEQVSVYLGIAGYTSQNKEDFFNLLHRYPFSKAKVDQDIAPIMASGIVDEDGIVVVLGTGIVVRVKSGRETTTIGGWGAFFEEGGSAFKIGRDAITAALRDIDGSGASTELTGIFAKKLGAPINEKITEIYKRGPNYIATFAGATVAAAMIGDPIAVHIMEQNAAEIAHMLDTAANRIGHREIRVRFSGTLCDYSEYLLPLILKYTLNDKTYKIDVMNERDPIFGTLILAGLPRGDADAIEAMIESRN